MPRRNSCNNERREESLKRVSRKALLTTRGSLVRGLRISFRSNFFDMSFVVILYLPVCLVFVLSRVKVVINEGRRRSGTIWERRERKDDRKWLKEPEFRVR